VSASFYGAQITTNLSPHLKEAHPNFTSGSFLDGLPSRSLQRGKSLLKASPPSVAAATFRVAAFVMRSALSEGWRLRLGSAGIR
jgi:hypothetical protein